MDKSGNKTGGRQKGTANKKTQQLEDLAKKLNVDPFEIMLNFAKGDYAALGYEKERVVGYTKHGDPIKEESIPPKLRQDSAKEVCGYLYPKRKAIEHSGVDGAPIQYETLENYLKRTASETPSNSDSVNH